MNRDPFSSLDMCFRELLCEEQHLATQATFQQDKLPTEVIDYAAHVKGKDKDMQKVQCYSYMEYGHIATRRVKKYCNYCKKPRHIIRDYPTRPRPRPRNHQATVSFSSSTTSDSSILISEMVKQMIISFFQPWDFKVKISYH